MLGPTSTGSCTASATRPRRWRASSASASRRSSPPAITASRSRRAGRPERRRRWSRRTPPPARTASPSSATPPTGAIATRSRTARIADRGSRSSATSPTTVRRRRWRRSRCASAAALSTRTPPTAASTPSRTPARTAVRGPCSATHGRGGGRRPGGGDAVEAAARALLDGRIVAVKGLGGYHLAAAPTTSARWRRCAPRKHREDKPFAVMAPDLEAARRLVELDARRGAPSDRAASGRSCVAPRRAAAVVAAVGRPARARPRA